MYIKKKIFYFICTFLVTICLFINISIATTTGTVYLQSNKQKI